MNPAEQRPGFKTQRAQDLEHEPVQLETVAAAPMHYELSKTRSGSRSTRRPGQDIEILERYAEELGAVERGQTIGIGDGRWPGPHDGNRRRAGRG